MLSPAMDEDQHEKQLQQNHLPTPPASVTHPDQPAALATMPSRGPLQFMELSVDIITLIIGHVCASFLYFSDVANRSTN
jgi:hypothetical protein